MANQSILQRAMQCLAIVLALSLSSLCFGEAVVVQVLNGKDGHPVPEQPVTMQLGYANSKYTMVLTQTTDANGEARIQLPPARPETLEVHVDLAHTPDDLQCWCRVLAKTETVMREGLKVAGRSRTSKSSAPIQPTPGRIVFVARPSSHLVTILFGE